MGLRLRELLRLLSAAEIVLVCVLEEDRCLEDCFAALTSTGTVATCFCSPKWEAVGEFVTDAVGDDRIEADNIVEARIDLMSGALCCHAALRV